MINEQERQLKDDQSSPSIGALLFLVIGEGGFQRSGHRHARTMEMHTLPTRIFLMPDTRLFCSNTLSLTIARVERTLFIRETNADSSDLPIDRLNQKNVSNTSGFIAQCMHYWCQHGAVDRWFTDFRREN